MLKGIAIGSLFVALFFAVANADAAMQCSDEEGSVATWRVGDDPAVLDAIGNADRCIVWGAELTYVQRNFTGLRGRKGAPIGAPGAVVTYVGDDAAFIVENL